jgi:2-keto-3-deoxy-6-phosphogluconate aldolase
VTRARELGVTVLPGIATPSELQAAVRAGLTAVKVFPVEQLGGLGFIDALSAPFQRSSSFPAGESGRIRRAAISTTLRCLRSEQAGWLAGRISEVDDST